MGDTKRVVLIGSTGSIGTQTLDVASHISRNVEIVGLAAGRNFGLLAQQVRRFRPAFAYSPALEGQGGLPRVWEGSRCLPLDEMVTLPAVDLVVIATVGRAGLAPTLAAIRAGKDVAIANKEVLVMAGELVLAEVQGHGARLIPIDSEHSALWQCLIGEEARSTEIRLILTASGGAFRDYDPAQLAQVPPAQALLHPTWSMGRKITIDSATLMNKGLEVIEARWLFDVTYDNIDVVLHRESIVHSMVEFGDGTVKAVLSLPDMRLPIQYALVYPQRLRSPVPRLDWHQIRQLTFGEVDLSKHPCLSIALEAARKGGTYPAVLSAADEVAVESFLCEEIGFLDIAPLVRSVLGAHNPLSQPSLDEVLAVDDWARREARRQVADFSRKRP